MTIYRVMVLCGAIFACASVATALAAEPNRIKDGHAVFERWCEPCHGHGPDKPGTTALQALYKGAKPALLEERTDLTPQIIAKFVRHGVSVMPFFRKTEVSDVELDALAAYLARKSH